MADKITYTEFCKKHDNLMFAPLDIELPPVTPAELVSWCEQTGGAYRNYAKEAGISIEELLLTLYPAHFETTNIMNLTSLFMVKESPNPITPSFANAFPEFESWFNGLSISTGINNVTIALLRQDNNTILDNLGLPDFSPIHHDNPGAYGLRIYLNNKNNNMFMFPKKERFGYDTFSLGIYGDKLHALDENQKVVTDSNGFPVPNDDYINKPVRARTPNKDTAFIMNEANSAHVVIREHQDLPAPDEEKFTFLILPTPYAFDQTYNWGELDQVINKAIDANKEYCIFYDEQT